MYVCAYYYAQQVKEAIKKERHKSQQDTRKALNKLRSGTGLLLAGTPAEALLQSRTGQSAMFPPLNIKGANLHLVEPRKPSDLPMADIQKVRELLLNNEIVHMRSFV